jgi:hypothetical protein
MKILIFHNRHSNFNVGGENIVFDKELKLLKQYDDLDSKLIEARVLYDNLIINK